MSTTVDPREAAFAVNVGDPLVVDVDQYGSGWTIVAVGRDTYRIVRGDDEVAVPHTAARNGR